MRVCVQGLWHLGSVTSACLASLGHDVVGLDIDAARIEELNRGSAPILENGLDELLKQGLSSGKLRFTADANEATRNIDVVWVTFDTPVDDDDNADVEFVINQVASVLPLLPTGVTVLISSQLPVGSIRRLEELAAKEYQIKQLSFACSPENLRLGKALEVFLKPDRIIVGTRSEKAKQALASLMQSITERIEWMSIESAEMTKHAINAFLATSVTFANEIASICELVGADAKQVERGLKTENRIGPKAYLSPGGAFAGGTLARDIAFLNHAAQSRHLKTPLLSAVKPSNNEHKNWVKRKLLSLLPDLPRASVAVWGLTYKPGTDTLRRSMSVELCNWLIEQGVRVHVHDPVVTKLPSHWEGKASRFENPVDAVTGTQALVVATEWPLYRTIEVDDLSRQVAGLVVLDANRFASKLMSSNALRYVAVGTPGDIE